MQGKTFIEADVLRVHCPKCGAQQIPVVWAEDESCFTELFEAYAIQVLQAVQSPVQAQWLTALSWGPVDRVMGHATHNEQPGGRLVAQIMADLIAKADRRATKNRDEAALGN